MLVRTHRFARVLLYYLAAVSQKDKSHRVIESNLMTRLVDLYLMNVEKYLLDLNTRVKPLAYAKRMERVLYVLALLFLYASATSGRAHPCWRVEINAEEARVVNSATDVVPYEPRASHSWTWISQNPIVEESHQYQILKERILESSNPATAG